MTRIGIVSVLLLAALTIISTTTLANPVPDPSTCQMVPADVMNAALVAPGHPSPIAACAQTITVRNSTNNPIVNAYVTVGFATGIATCPDAVLNGYSNLMGQVVLNLTAGGCLLQQDACTVTANGVIIRLFPTKSPDRDGSLSVDLSDLIDFAGAYQVNAPGCQDYDNLGGTRLPDLLIFAAAYAPRHFCP